MGIKQEFGQKIKRMRINRGLTQEELAEAADLSQRAMSGIETGENFVSAETLDKLVLALDTSTEELFATDHLKMGEDLRQFIDAKLDIISSDPTKLAIVYSVVKSLSKE